MTFVSSCSQFTLLNTSDEARRDLSYFKSEEDFPGSYEDENQAWDSSLNPLKNRLNGQSSRSGKLLTNELKRLESVQSEEDFDFYQEYRDKLKTVSEKIFFLKLSPYDRQDYLASRGFLLAREEMAQREPAQYFKLRKNEVAFGMRKPDVLDSLGKPLRVEVAGNPRHENERWLYQLNGAPKYIYFESGEVQGWE